jgi:hypothetical protein
MKVTDIVKELEYEIIDREPAMDDYDAGVIEGLRLARELVSKSSVQTDTPPPGNLEDPFSYHTSVM